MRLHGIVANDHAIQRICAEMHIVGMELDPEERKRLEREYRYIAKKHYRKLMNYAESVRKVWRTTGKVKIREYPFNPGSRDQVARLLFDDWNVIPTHFTATGDASTGDPALRGVIFDPGAPAHIKGFCESLRKWRGAVKVLGTYLWPMMRYTDDPDKKGWLRPGTNRVHADWKAHTVVTGRLSTSPNLQNVPIDLRSVFVPAPGNVFVYADADQLELRVAAALGGAKRYLEAFAKGEDPHQITMYLIFGDEIWDWEGAPPPGQRYQKKWKAGPWGIDGAHVPAGAIHGFFDAQRDLGKRVCYACAKEGTEVAVLDERGAIPIEAVAPGDWTTVWSRKRHRYEPARIKRAWKTGERACVRVTLKAPSGKQVTVTFTPDHQFLLRDGTYRPAGWLQAGDRLMPYKRWSSNGYRMIDPANDGTREHEHRMVAGAVVGDGTHVHHVDEDRRNNHPANLQALTPREHAAEHPERSEAAREASRAAWAADSSGVNARLSAARKASPVWREAVTGSAAQARSSKRAQAFWASPTGEAERRRRSGPQPSMLDAYADRIGLVPDTTIAREAGCTPENVGHWRQKRGIAACRKPLGSYVEQIHAQRERLGQDTDAAIAADLGCDRTLVQRVRRALGISTASRAGRKRGPQGSALVACHGLFGRLRGAEIAQLAAVSGSTVSAYATRHQLPGKQDKALHTDFMARIGHASDATLGAEWGVEPGILALYRQIRGVPEHWQARAAGATPHNHIVVSVEHLTEPVPVWDLEVEHEDHNFALAAGIFVHNSLYAATAETVHEVITCSEDRDGVLMYADLSLMEVKAMHKAWLDNAPEIVTGWATFQAEYEQFGYVASVIHKRRRYCLDGPELNTVVNFPCQSTGADYINEVTREIVAKYPCNFAGPNTGLINQTHDALTLEVPEELGPQVAKDLQEAFTRVYAALPGVVLRGEAKIKKRWEAPVYKVKDEDLNTAPEDAHAESVLVHFAEILAALTTDEDAADA